MDYTHYYTPDRLVKMKQAQNYQELLAIALEVLVDLNRNHFQPVAQVCGPITNGGRGSQEENTKIFERVIKQVCANGLTVFNQMPFQNDLVRIFQGHKDRQSETRLLEEFYGVIFAAGLVQLLCFFPGWESSLGAVWEKQRGQELGIPILYLSDYYLIDP